MFKFFKYSTLSLAFLPLNLFSQNIISPDSSKMPNDLFVVNVLNNTWLNSPSDVKLMPVSIGSEVYYTSPVIGKLSKLSVAIGVGISINNIHNNSLLYDSMNTSYFKPVPGGYNYYKNKISTSYLEVPLEFRFRTMPDIKKRNFKVTLGAKFGYLLSSYMKYSGEDFRNHSSKNVKFKEYRLSNILPYRYSAFLRIGYGKINFIVNYTFVPLFEKNKGPDCIPLSYGLSFTFY